MPKFEERTALNDGEVTAVYQYLFGHPEHAVVHSILFNGIDIWYVMNPEDQDYFVDKAPELAKQHMEELRQEAMEQRAENRREQLSAQA